MLLSQIFSLTHGVCTHQNTTAVYDTSSFSTSCSKFPDRNPTTLQKGSIFFTRYNNTQKMITSNETRLTVAIVGIIISEGLSFGLSQKPRFKKVLDLARSVSKHYQPPTESLYLRIFWM